MNLPHPSSPWERPSVDSTQTRPSASELPPPAAPPSTPLSPPMMAAAGPNPPKKSGGAGRALGFGLLAVAAMVGSGVVGAFVYSSVDDDPLPPQRASEASLEVSESRTSLPDGIEVAEVAEYVAPSVVTISADVEGGFAETGQSVGTGVIITSDGEVLTNAHVIEGATEVRVRLTGESEPRSATVLASDPGNDLALLRIAGDDFVPATFAAPGSVRIGDEVVAIGFALDLDGGPSVTLGIVSALDRTIGTGSAFLDGLIQTDAAISSGNSGGPLVNAAGEVVGINTAVARGDFSVAASNIGFAISVDEALPIVDQLRAQAEGAVRTDGYLGVRLDERTDGGQGAIVVAVEDDTPAALAGILAGDIVIEVDGTPINGGTGLIAAIRDREPGDEISIAVLRDGELLEFQVVLAERPEA